MKPKFRPGDIVVVGGQVEAIIAYEFYPLPCLMHMVNEKGPVDHAEWANVLTLKGDWLFHVGECQMEYSSFGKELGCHSRNDQ